MPVLSKLAAFLTAFCLSSAAAAAPGVGDMAPDWSLQGSDGQTHHMADLRGKHVVIAFFPKAYTSG